MDISANSYNQPVSFYTKNTENMINTVIDRENRLAGENVFASSSPKSLMTKPVKKSIKKHGKNKRLNTYDTEYLPDETIADNIKTDENNFFVEKEQNKLKDSIKKTIVKIYTKIPLINYFYMRQKKEDIKKTVEQLNDISQNVDELMNSVVPYGEDEELYKNIANKLTDAVNIIGRANKKV